MKYLCHILILISLVGCCQKTSQNKEDCPLKKYVHNYPNKISVHTVYYDCESDWKFKLQIKKNEDFIFKADTMLKYEFKNHKFPTYISTNSFEYLLIQREDRPPFKKTDVFRINRDEIDSVFSIPEFYLKGMDIDRDSIQEYWSTSSSELISNGSGTIGYDPILVYEIESNHFNFDSTTTIKINEKVYGEYHGLSVIDTLYFNGNQIEEKFPYPYPIFIMNP